MQEQANTKNHLIVVSVDALVYEDLEYAKNFPAFGKILSEGSRIDKVLTIYPALTHPIHATIMTGCTPGVTKIICNEEFTPGQLVRPWYNWLNQVDCDTIFHAAKRAGLTTAACCWPVTAGGGDVIDYLVPEVLIEYVRKHEDNPAEAFRMAGTSECLMDMAEEWLAKKGYSNGHPDYDEFEMDCAVEIIRRYKPNVLFTHPSLVDSARHRSGVFSDEVKEAIRITDGWLMRLMDAVREAGIEEETDFVVLSDHGHLNINRIMCPNVLLADAGYIRTDEEGNLKDWDAYVTSGALSAHVYLSRPEDKKLYAEVYEYLQKLAEEKIYGFERVFTREEVKERYGLDGDFSFVLETDGFTSFADSWVRPLVQSLDISDYRFGHATHGHMPEKGPQPPFLVMGPSFKRGVVIPNGSILDHAPTFAKVLGVELPEAQGKAVEALLAEEG